MPAVVDQNVELRKSFRDLLRKEWRSLSDRKTSLSEGVKFWKRPAFRTVHLSLIAARDKNRGYQAP